MSYLRLLAVEVAFVAVGVAVGAFVYWVADRIMDARDAWCAQ